MKNKIIHNKKVRFSIELEAATGQIDYTLKNDYMFHVTLQNSSLVLRGLIGSLLHLKQEEIKDIKILNPILPGQSIDHKQFILDIHIVLNDNTGINLELQIRNDSNWPDRSLIYLCRSFDTLNRGMNYSDIQPVYHIGILDYTLFPEYPEFYACNMLMNIKNHKIFNDKFLLNVLSLNQIELATDEDQFWEIDIWARLFKAKTWEEIKMLAENNEVLTEAAETIYKNNADQIIRWQCQAREDYENHERYIAEKMKELTDSLVEKDIYIKELEDKLESLQSQHYNE